MCYTVLLGQNPGTARPGTRGGQGGGVGKSDEPMGQ